MHIFSRASLALILCCTSSLALANSQKLLAKYQGEAVDAAEKEAKFTMDCDDISSQVISAKIDEVPSRIWLERLPIERQQYEVGVEGCGERRAYKVICDEKRGCTVLR